MSTDSKEPLRLAGSKRGRRLLPSLVDELAQTDPDRTLYSIPKENDPTKGFVDISARCFARAVDRCAKFIEAQLGPAGEGFPTLTYMGPQDLVYGILIFATIKVGYKLLLTSPRNTLEAQIYLFDRTDCHTFLMPPKFPLPIVKEILATRQMHVVETPGLQHWLAEGPSEAYPYNKSFESAQYEPFVVLHTSGSTGLPKPVVQTHATWTPMDAQCDLPAIGFKPVFPSTAEGKRMYMTFPLFHCAGVAMLIPAPIYCGFTAVLGPWPPSADVANSVHLHGNVQQLVCVPTILVDLAKDPEHLNNLSRLELITFGGGPLPPAIGSLITAKTRLQSVLGTTEAGVMPVLVPDRDDWTYMSFSPSLGQEFRHVSGELYEHVIVRNERLLPFQSIFGTFKDIQEWPMKDLYSKHPHKENAWLYRGRTDDIIVFSTGEKLNPLTMETIINANPLVSAAIVAGVGKFQASLLIEAQTPPTSELEESKLLDQIWPAVEAANEQAPQHGQIYRNMVVFTKPERPMLKAGKGTVQRKLTLDLYQAELDHFYNQAEQFTVNGKHTATSNNTNINEAMLDVLSVSTSINPRTVDSKANFFELGIDSLQVTVIARRLSELMQSFSGKPISPRDIYANPSLQRLQALIHDVREAGPKNGTEVITAEVQMQTMFEQLCDSLPVTARPIEPKSDSDVVLLTGSTGSLGSYILDAFMRNANVSTIYCLNRGQSSNIRQSHSHTTKGLSASFEKVHFLEADYGASNFGLPLSTYRKILSEVTQVVHNAWQVDFNLDFESFTKQLLAVRRLVNFSAHSRFGARLFFVSSVGSVSNYIQNTNKAGPVPEQVFHDWNICQSAGYGQSKLVAERLLDAACQEADVPVTICRLGQIAGPTTPEGLWPRQEWFPSLLASAKHLGKLPSSLGSMDTIDWVPVDKAGEIVAELALKPAGLANGHAAESATPTTVYHLVNSKQTKWSDLAPGVKAKLEVTSASQLQLVSLNEWIHLLEQSADAFDDLAKNPAAKIVDFFKSIGDDAQKAVALDTENSRKFSKTLAELDAVNDAWMDNWLRQWGY